MKRTTPKLTICRETLRVLADLELARVAGGDPVLFDTGNPLGTCLHALPLPSAAVAAGCPAATK
jgi:hypothetical protein